MSALTNVRVSGWLNTGRVELYVLDCANCGVIFAIPVDYEDRRRDDGKNFYCPNGHTNAWSDTKEKRLQREKERLDRQLANAQEDARAYRASLIATKGHLTKARKRADAGVCQHCKRTFANVQRHVAHMHPDAVAGRL